MKEFDKKTLQNTRLSMLRSERASFYPHWQELSAYLLPRNGRFFLQDRNKGWKRNNAIYDNTGLRSAGILAAGMMAGMTSPARPWFKLTTADPDLADSNNVKIWLSDCTTKMQTIFQKSNAYRALHQMYLELGVFGTSGSVVNDDFDNVIRLYPMTIGEYMIAQDYRGHVCTVYRQFEKQVSDLVKEFGYENCSTTVRNQYDRGSLDNWIPIVHVIEPNEDRDPAMIDSRNKMWVSDYYEVGGDKEIYLRQSGFDKFPALVPRWETAGGDIYGNSPGMIAIGDVKQLQHEQLRKAQGIDFKTKPPLQVPTNMKQKDVENLPGGITYYDAASPTGAIKPLYEVNLDLSHLLEDIQDVRQRIKSAFFEDLFLMMANDTRSGITATEIAERHEEKMLMLGPVLERLNDELLNPLIDMTFEKMVKGGMLPPAPPELQGQEIGVEFVSMLAQAQKAVATNSIDKFVGNLGMVAQFKPEVLDKFDADEWADVYSDSIGVDPRLIVDSKNVAIIRQQRAQQQQQAAQAAQAEAAANTAAKLGTVQTGGNSNAAADMLANFQGYT